VTGHKGRMKIRSRQQKKQERITRPPWIQNARPCPSDAWDEQDKMRRLAVWYNPKGRSVMVLGTFRRRPMSRRFKSQGTLKWQVQVSKGSKKSTRSRQAADDAILDRSTALDDLRCIFFVGSTFAWNKVEHTGLLH
jgi:hypothetical protein